MSDDSLSIAVVNDVPAVSRATEEVEAFCRARGIADAVARKFTLVLDETLTNAVSYGFPQGGLRSIAVRIEHRAGYLAATVSDDGAPFDPLAILIPRALSERTQQRQPDLLPAPSRVHEQVFKEKIGAPSEGAERVVEEGHSDRPPLGFRQQRISGRRCAEQRTPQIGLGRHDLVCQRLVVGQPADQPKNSGQIGGAGRAQTGWRGRHSIRLSGSSITCLSTAMNSAPLAPSATR